MSNINETLEALVDKLRESMGIETYLVGATPATFELNTAYVIYPEEVNVEHCIGNGSFQQFEVEILIPLKQTNNGHVETLDRSIMEASDNINRVLSDTFKRQKIIGGGNIYATRFGISQWEVNGYIYSCADVTVFIKSFLNV